jgi:hypothetical protein
MRKALVRIHVDMTKQPALIMKRPTMCLALAIASVIGIVDASSASTSSCNGMDGCREEEGVAVDTDAGEGNIGCAVEGRRCLHERECHLDTATNHGDMYASAVRSPSTSAKTQPAIDRISHALRASKPQASGY